MQDILEKLNQVEGSMFKIGGARFFNDRDLSDELEWLTLGKAVTALLAAGSESPRFAIKQEGPDFVTFRADGSGFAGIEVTEVLRPGYRRNEHHQLVEDTGKQIHEFKPPHPKPWSSLASTVRKKFMKAYAANNCWLLIYHDMSRSDFHSLTSPEFDIPWCDWILAELSTWNLNSEDSVDLRESPFQRVLMLSSGLCDLVEIFPHPQIIWQTSESAL